MMNKRLTYLPFLMLLLSGCTVVNLNESENKSEGNSSSVVSQNDSKTSEITSVSISQDESESETSTSETSLSENSSGHESSPDTSTSEETSFEESSEDVSLSESSQTSTSQSETPQYVTKSVTFYGNSKMPSNGSHFSDTKQTPKLVSMFNEIESDFVKNDEILVDNTHSTLCEEQLVLQVGSGSASGGFMFESNYDVKSIKVVCSPYYKTYIDTWTNPGEPYTVYSVDNYCEVEVNGVKKDITYEGSTKPNKDNLVYSFTSVNEISLFTTENSQRLFIYSMEFTYLAK